MKKPVAFCLLFFILSTLKVFADNDTLINSNASWKYLDNGTNQGTNWKSKTFNDASWATGTAQFGYGDGDESTIVSYGPNASNKYITTYFRKSFTVSNPALYTSLELQLLRDDGAKVFLNGTNVAKSNMPSGTISYTTLASTTQGTAKENKYYSFSINPTLLVSGNNVIAVEVHQYNATSDDLGFALRLIGTFSSCPIPANLSTTNITTSSADLSWNGVSGAVSYNIQYRLVGAGSWTNTTSVTNSKNISSLTPSSNYEWEVQTVCASNQSIFSSTNNFTTLTPPCNVPANLSVANITSSSADLSWNAVSGAVSYNIQYHIVGAGSWTNTTSATNSKNVLSLVPSSNYEWQVQTVCASNQSAFSSSNNFTTLTLQPCSAPTGLSVNAITSSSASLSWTAVTGAVSYAMQYRLIGGSWNSVSSGTTSVNLSGLSNARTYECKVQTVCQSSSSVFSSSVSFTTQQSVNDSLVNVNASWKYLDNGTDQGTAWRGASFNDSSWISGNAELGYGDGDETTVVSYGTNASAKYTTTYFRKTISVTDPSLYNAVSLGVVRDDGIVVYINGTEVYRANMPTGTITSATFASAAISGADESIFQNATLSPSVLTAGTNVIAIEIHQSDLTSSDISFKLRLVGTNNTSVITTQRGPYLQMLTPNAIHIRWKTDIATNSRVRFGTDMSYGTVVDSSSSLLEHEIKISGLNPNTKYYYTIGSTTKDLQGDAINFFKTSLPAGSTTPFRVWAMGDFGNGSSNQDLVRNAYTTYVGNNPANLWIWLGDNAYDTGTETEFTNNVFAKYPAIMKSTPIYPGLGNHDYANVGYQSASALGTNFPYFSLFTCPKNAEAGGVPSGTEKYYSYNYGNVHFIEIDSYGALSTSGSAMYNWLQSDLAANTQRWVVAYWHHPPYTMGTHNSDSGTESINIRQAIIPLLESYKVDLVLCGHSHVYERSVLLNGHYGLEGSLTPAMKIDAGSGNAPYYLKSSPNFTGTVYAVVGCSGQGGSVSTQTSWPHAAMYSYAKTLYGSMVIDFNSDTLAAKFLTSTGTIYDQFKIVKSGTARLSDNILFDENSDQDLIVFPNPFTTETTIRYRLDEESPVTIEVFDMTGRKIYSFNKSLPTIQPAGMHEIYLNNDLLKNKNGLFMVRLKTNSKVLNKLIERIE